MDEKDIKIGQMVGYRDYARLPIVEGEVICISKVKDCLYKDFIGKIILDVREKTGCLTTKVWLDEVISIKEGDTDV